MRTIDGDALLNILNPHSLANRGIRFAGLRSGRTIELARLLLIKLLEDAPTIDAVPVVHARWLPRGSDDNDAGMYYCSACKDERYFGDEVITSEEASKYCLYCPNCGAKMDGGASDV